MAFIRGGERDSIGVSKKGLKVHDYFSSRTTDTLVLGGLGIIRLI